MVFDMRRVGILGGTFDPIHLGHLHLANAALTSFCLDCVLFMPTDDPYYKAKSNVSSFDDRFRMTQLAVEGSKGLIASDFERVHDTDGYTVNTLKAYKQLYPEEELYFIIGGDSLFSMEKWKDVEQIFSMAHILVNKRKDEAKGASGSLSVSDTKSQTTGTDRFLKQSAGDRNRPDPMVCATDLDVELENQIHYLKEKYHASICNLHAEQFDISSSELRSMIKEGRDVSAWLPQSVIDYIHDKQLYI